MEIILKEDVLNLGFTNDIVSVKDGYARNYLFPQRLAIPATDSNKKVLQEMLRQRSHKLEQAKVQADLLAGKLRDVLLKIKMKSSSEGTVYGSVTNAMVAEALKNQYDIEIDRKKINIPGGHIKELGQHKINIPLHKEINVELTLDIVPEE
ncbi:MAG: 50S ribosomal protein L9 [Bacteroidales bacterium]|jgi:large subunit ribosomal protein L9|nr:50S ribosomal protein L9 [Bacteroidales bacterium]